MLASLLDGFSALADGWCRGKFRAKEKIQFYESMVALLENGVTLNEALKEVGDVYSDRGKHPRHPIALACSAMALSVQNGKKLADACQGWMSYQEVAIIAAGERSGNLLQAFFDCVRILEAQQKILSLVLSSSLYPALLWSLMAYLLQAIATKMVPALARRSDPESWTGAPALLYCIANYVDQWGLVTLISGVLLLILAILTLPYFCGPLRVLLEPLNSPGFFRHSPSSLRNAFQTLPGTADC